MPRGGENPRPSLLNAAEDIFLRWACFHVHAAPVAGVCDFASSSPRRGAFHRRERRLTRARRGGPSRDHGDEDAGVEWQRQRTRKRRPAASPEVAGSRAYTRTWANLATARRSATESNAASARSEVPRPARPTRGRLRRRERVSRRRGTVGHHAGARRKTPEARFRGSGLVMSGPTA